ncbi:unnamed protein product [Arctia plantaginis]|uniref:Uncharacterized protein n=1 Tax=Arctia plantaginis TaxID=874455 RepID=A0A8S0ZER2_ARCPL|nr:unnamed protein product [Arctia plantaginis]CAB3248120.1 unnamed protein product [Arctia plantaginis]
MLQLIVYGLLLFLTLLAIFDIIRLCTVDNDASKRRLRMWCAPYDVVKNTLKGMKTLKEEKETPEPGPETKPYNISETV